MISLNALRETLTPKQINFKKLLSKFIQHRLSSIFFWGGGGGGGGLLSSKKQQHQILRPLGVLSIETSQHIWKRSDLALGIADLQR